MSIKEIVGDTLVELANVRKKAKTQLAEDNKKAEESLVSVKKLLESNG